MDGSLIDDEVFVSSLLSLSPFHSTLFDSLELPEFEVPCPHPQDPPTNACCQGRGDVQVKDWFAIVKSDTALKDEPLNDSLSGGSNCFVTSPVAAAGDVAAVEDMLQKRTIWFYSMPDFEACLQKEAFDQYKQRVILQLNQPYLIDAKLEWNSSLISAALDYFRQNVNKCSPISKNKLKAFQCEYYQELGIQERKHDYEALIMALILLKEDEEHDQGISFFLKEKINALCNSVDSSLVDGDVMKRASLPIVKGRNNDDICSYLRFIKYAILAAMVVEGRKQMVELMAALLILSNIRTGYTRGGGPRDVVRTCKSMLHSIMGQPMQIRKSIEEKEISTPDEKKKKRQRKPQKKQSKEAKKSVARCKDGSKIVASEN